MKPWLRLVAATALVAAAGLTGPSPAYAEACSTDAGVTVVVDFHELGGGLQQVCDPGGGGQKASALFPDNGFPLTYVQRQPGFVCRVSGAPADDPCVNTPPPDAYWGLWWSDGETGTWNYSSAGAASLTVPEGGSVAFSWNGSSTKSPPGAPPPEHEPEEEPSEQPEPTRQPTTRPSEPPASGGGARGGSGTPSASASGSATASPGTGDRRGTRDDDPDGQEQEQDRRGGDRGRDDPIVDDEPSEESSETVAADGSAVDEPSASGDDSALPVWVGPTAVAGLLAVAGVATYLRRRAS